jgi:hypothetical protein
MKTTHTGYAVFDPDGQLLWYTVRPEKELSVCVHESATHRHWRLSSGQPQCEIEGYTVRKLKLTEVK